MNNQDKEAIEARSDRRSEIERTPEMIKNGEPTIGTKHAGQEGADYVAHADSEKQCRQ